MTNLYTQIGDAARKQQEQLDQARLENDVPSVNHSPSKSKSEQTQKPGKIEAKESGNPDSQIPRNPDIPSAPLPQSSDSSQITDTNLILFEPEPPILNANFEKGTYEITEEHLDFVNRTNYELRKWKIRKRDIVQTALELLAKDYESNKEQSYLLRKFQSHKPKSESS